MAREEARLRTVADKAAKKARDAADKEAKATERQRQRDLRKQCARLRDVCRNQPRVFGQMLRPGRASASTSFVRSTDLANPLSCPGHRCAGDGER